MTAQLEMRPYRQGEEAEILALYRESFGQQLEEAIWRWRFRNSPAGPAVIYLAWDNNVLAAHYAVTAVTLSIDGQDWLTGLSGTTMTHPGYRGQGLFPELASATYAHMAATGMATVWGFPNALSHRGFVRDLGWADIYEVPTLHLPLLGRLRLPPASREVVELNNLDARFDDLWTRIGSDIPVAVKRDCSYLQWRFVENPAQRYRILAYIDGPDLLGYAAFKHYENELQVVDILTVPDIEIGLALIAQVVELGLQEEAHSVGLWLNVRHPLHHALERAGFTNGEPVTYFGALALQQNLSKAYLYDYANWYLTMGDSDVF